MSLLTPPNCRTLVQSSQSVTGAKLTGAWSNYSLSLIDRTGSLSYVRVEDQWNQVGTTCSHWRENTFKQELMTGFVSISGSNPLSLLTAYSLMDLGYQIDPTSDAINKTYDVSTAIYDELPGKPADGFGLEGCLDDFKGVKTV